MKFHIANQRHKLNWSSRTATASALVDQDYDEDSDYDYDPKLDFSNMTY